MLKIKEEKGNRDEVTQEEVTHVAPLSKLAFHLKETAEFATTLSKLWTWWSC